MSITVADPSGHDGESKGTVMSGEWRPDPGGQFQFRWWDGQQWTDQVANGQDVSTAPLPAPPTATTAPTPGPQPAPASTGPASISGDLLDGRYAEGEGDAVSNQNSKMLRVRVGEPFMARQGSMVAYQGAVQFDYQGGGAAKFIKKAVTGEGLSLMRVAGQGDVFLANQNNEVHILRLANSGISINGTNVLAFSTSLDWNIDRMKAGIGGVAAGGLFNTTLRGTGWVAITTDGPPVVLDTAEAPTFADTDAIVAWSADLQASLNSTFKATSLVGRGSGEAFQITFHGHGFAIVQPSEGISFPTTA